MRIVRATLGTFFGLGAAALLSVSLLAGGQTMSKDAMTHGMPISGTMMTKEQKIVSATAAAPATITAKATILDWPAKEGDKPTTLREGTNGWTCLPDMRETEGVDPMCLDQTWMTWFDGYMAHTTPQIATLGIAYMIAPGGEWGSNTDPFAITKTADNRWTLHAPHLMIAVPDTKALEGLPTDPNNGGPYVMWKGTPYAHIMAPVATPTMNGMRKK